METWPVYAMAMTVNAAMSSTITRVSRKVRTLTDDAAADQTEDAERERGVGAHDDSPAPGGRLAGVEREVDEGGRRHAAYGGQYRRGNAPSFAQVAHVELATDLEADYEEEQGDQTVVDPVAEVERQFVGTEAECELGGPHPFIDVRPARVRPGQSRQCRSQQNNRTRVLCRDERTQRYRQSLCARHLRLDGNPNRWVRGQWFRGRLNRHGFSAQVVIARGTTSRANCVICSMKSSRSLDTGSITRCSTPASAYRWISFTMDAISP